MCTSIIEKDVLYVENRIDVIGDIEDSEDDVEDDGGRQTFFCLKAVIMR